MDQIHPLQADSSETPIRTKTEKRAKKLLISKDQKSWHSKSENFGETENINKQTGYDGFYKTYFSYYRKEKLLAYIAIKNIFLKSLR